MKLVEVVLPSDLFSLLRLECAGTSQPVHRSRAEAASRYRSTGTAVVPVSDSGPPDPALLRFRRQRKRKREREEKLVEDALLCAQLRMSPALLKRCTDDAGVRSHT
ncbi:Hypothetical predicted protein [Scomber scombrus]|uniref:Uncharacterized protein n=1 Tax=Scomber scombrus TaxID=13677 RepID=A0AAV1PWG5_SCOSC